jgi:hypothetical protein
MHQIEQHYPSTRTGRLEAEQIVSSGPMGGVNRLTLR